MQLKGKGKTEHAHYQCISKAIVYLLENHLSQPSLNELSHAVGMSEYHLQKVFSEWAGVSPKQFLQFVTKEHAKSVLRQATVLEASVSSGLSGGGRLHDLLIKCESVTPGEFKKFGEGIKIEYGTHLTRFGHCLVATTDRGVCKLAFFDSHEELDVLLRELHTEWRNSIVLENTPATGLLCDQIFENNNAASVSLKLFLRGTPFRLQVWEALLRIPEGRLVSYQQVADGIGKPTSTRAVASAIANNPIGYLIPCHRVIRSTGILNQYRWGAERKVAIVGFEQCNSELGANSLVDG